jgi:hypothetical protein
MNRMLVLIPAHPKAERQPRCRDRAHGLSAVYLVATTL